MLLEITVPDSTLYTWLFIIIILLIIMANALNNKYKNSYEQKATKDRDELNKAIAEFKIKENELGKITAETRQKAAEWGMIELEKFKQTELEAQKKIITENALITARNILTQWIAENEERIRKDAANRSVRNVLGKVTEHLIPFSEAMKQFNPKDIRFIGSPIDLIVFEGAEELKRDEITIHFIEVKTGTSTLSKRQQLIREAVINKRVEWLRVNMKSFGDEVNEALA